MSDRLCACGCGLPLYDGKTQLHPSEVQRRESRQFRWGHKTNHYNERPQQYTRAFAGRDPETFVWTEASGRRRRRVRKSRVLGEAALGRAFRAGECVFHADLRTDNDTPGTLVVCDFALRQVLLWRAKAYQATGNANARKCVYCKRWDTQPSLTILRLSGGSIQAYHQECKRAYQSSRHRGDNRAYNRKRVDNMYHEGR